MKRQQRNLFMVGTAVIALFLVVLVATMLWDSPSTSVRAEQAEATNPVLSVITISPKLKTLPVEVQANGNVMAWQEASIGNQSNGLKLAEVLVDIGEVVEQGQLLATFVTDTVQAELTQSHASVEEAEAFLAEAEANARRAREMQSTQAISAQQIQQYLTTKKIAQARLQLIKATEKTKQVQLNHTRVLAPDDGIISSRQATVGAVLSTGEELFRLIRQGRLEWRAEVAAPDLKMLKPGQLATITLKNGKSVQGKLRIVSPVVDMQTRNALVYVDLPQSLELKAGMFAQGMFEVDDTQALTLPQSAVLQRNGFSYVFCVNRDSRVEQTKVALGRRSGELIEILEGIDSLARVVETGAGFLGDGDFVRVVEDQSDDNTMARGEAL